MAEALAFWSGLRSWEIGLALLPLGLILGSFCTVVWHRVPRGESIVRPGSHCPNCGHRLRGFDLVPVLSYVWLRGRCRLCGTQISPRYVCIELLCGMATAAAGATWGWSAGLGVIVAIVSACFVSASWRRRLGSQAGFTLVEVLASALLFMFAVGGTFEALRVARWSSVVAQRRTEAVALARSYLSVAAGQVSTGWNPVSTGTESTYSTVDSGFVVTTRYMVHPSVSGLWGVEITISCQTDCGGAKSPSGVEARLLGVVHQ